MQCLGLFTQIKYVVFCVIKDEWRCREQNHLNTAAITEAARQHSMPFQTPSKSLAAVKVNKTERVFTAIATFSDRFLPKKSWKKL